MVREQQQNALTERQLQRDVDDRAREDAAAARILAERQLEENDRARADAAAARAHEVEMIRLRGEAQPNNQNNRNKESQWREEDWATIALEH